MSGKPQGKSNRQTANDKQQTEAKESGYWLRLLSVRGDAALEAERAALAQDAIDLTRILSATIEEAG